MTDWNTLREEIEMLLGSSQKWDERELMLYSNWCIRRVINIHFPLDASTVLSTDGTTQSWSVPDDFLAVRRVEVPANHFLEEIQIRPGTAFYSTVSGLPNMYYVENDLLELTYPPSSSNVLTLHYEGKHTEMSSDTTTVTVDNQHIEVLALYVAMRALTKFSIKQAGQDAFKMPGVDSGNPQQNPYTPLIREFRRQYQEALFGLLPTGNVEMYRRGRGA